jgi:hypothetical protein
VKRTEFVTIALLLRQTHAALICINARARLRGTQSHKEGRFASLAAKEFSACVEQCPLQGHLPTNSDAAAHAGDFGPLAREYSDKNLTAAATA